MTDLDLARVKQLFLLACELPVEQRAAFLDASHDVPADVRAQVARQLGRLEQPDDLQSPCVELAAPRDPEWIGPYRVLRTLGEGGMGVVYVAEQSEPVHRKVAVKRIRLGMDSAAVVARFAAERDVLALMDHPCIAHVLDAGIDATGRPYFAMALVDGPPLDEYCDRRRLDLTARLRVFVDVCRGVQYAHHKGVLHRDLKPGNVLVVETDGRPVPKIIDFGIAKALGPEIPGSDLHTVVGALLGTPGYMSPEQAESGRVDVDTRSDVYSLGVILYELLSGYLPFDAAALPRDLAGLARTLRESTPPRPSTRVAGGSEDIGRIAHARRLEPRRLAQRLHGDLDWISMRALATEREQRYESPGALAEDIERFLSGRPVLAGPPTLRYRAGKFLRRHKVTVAAAAVVLLGLLSATGIALRYALVASAERDRAVGARRSLTNLYGLLQQADPFLANDPRIRPRQALDQAAAEIVVAYADDPAGEAGARLTLGGLYWTRGNLQPAFEQFDRASTILASLPDTSALARYDAARARATVANQLGMAVRLVGYDELFQDLFAVLARGDAQLERPLRELIAWANGLWVPLDAEGARERWHAVHAYLQQHAADGDPRWRVFADCTLSAALGAAHRRFEWQLSAGWFAAVEDLYEQRAGLGPVHMSIALAREQRLQLLFKTDRFEQGRALAEESLARFSVALPPDHWLLDTLGAWRALGRHAQGEDVESELRAALERLQAVLGPSHVVTRNCLAGLIEVLASAGATAEVEQLRDRLLDVLIATPRPRPVHDVSRYGLRHLALALGPGRESVIECLQVFEQLVPADVSAAKVSIPPVVADLVEACRDLDVAEQAAVEGYVLGVENRPFNHLSVAVALELRRPLTDALAPAVDAVDTRVRVNHLLLRSVTASEVSHDPATSLEHARRAVALEQARPDWYDATGWSQVVLGLQLMNLGRDDEALECIREGYRFRTSVLGPLTIGADRSFDHLVQVHACVDGMEELVPDAIARARELVRGGATTHGLRDASWAIVRVPGLDAETYDLALRCAREAADRPQHSEDVEPADTQLTLGLAAYRAGQWDQACSALERSAELRAAAGREPWPPALWFLALALERLGLVDEARLAYAGGCQRDDAGAEPSRDMLVENRRFRAEAEALFAGG